MALIIEDGSNVPNANSYIDVDFARSFAIGYGLDLPADDSAVEILIRKAMNKVESYWNDFQGERTYSDQSLSWPRQNVWLYGSSFPSDAIPETLKNAVAQFTYDATTNDLMANRLSSTATIEERVEGAVTVKYATPNTSDGRSPEVVFTQAEAYLEPLLKRFLGAYLEAVRV